MRSIPPRSPSAPPDNSADNSSGHSQEGASSQPRAQGRNTTPSPREFPPTPVSGAGSGSHPHTPLSAVRRVHSQATEYKKASGSSSPNPVPQMPAAGPVKRTAAKTHQLLSNGNAYLAGAWSVVAQKAITKPIHTITERFGKDRTPALFATVAFLASSDPATASRTAAAIGTAALVVTGTTSAVGGGTAASNLLSPESFSLAKLEALTKKAKKTERRGEVTAFLAAFNVAYAPRITQENAALERLAMATCYLNLHEGDELVFNVTNRDLTLEKAPEAIFSTKIHSS
jgi:hypothetical protein